MATSVGQLTIEMAANIVRLQQDMEKAKNTVAGAMQSIQKSASAAATALGAIGVGLSVAAFTGWIRSAIDAADETNKMAQKIGVAVKDVAGLQLAFRQAGIEGGALQTSMSKLSVAIANGNDALVAMNINTRNTDGTLKSTRQVLGEVADKFKSYEDGASKTALAVQLFGKAGADLIPLLNAGSDSLDQFDEMARKLGLTLTSETAARAEKFNDTLDLMGQGFKGIAMQVAAEMLPTLEGLADQFFSSMTEGDRLKRIAEGLSIGLKGLYITVVLVYEAVETMVDTLYTAGRQIYAVMSGDIQGAMKLGTEWSGRMKTNWTSALDEVDKAWNANGSTAVSTMTAITAATKKEAPYVSDATKKQTDELKKQEDAYLKLITSIDEKVATNKLEVNASEKLTESQKLEVKYTTDLENGTLKLTKAQQDNLFAKLKGLKATEDAVALAKLEKDILDDSAKSNYAVYESILKKNKSIEDEIAKQKESNDTMFLGAEAVAKLEVQKLRDQATTAQRNADLAEEAFLSDGVVNGYKDQAKALKDLADAKEKGIGLKAAKDAQDAWDKAATSITEGLTDALMRGFESGKGFVDNILSFIKNKFKSTVAEFIIRPIMSPIGAAFSSMMPTAAGAASSSGGLFGSILGGASQLGSLFGSGVSGTMGGASLSSMMTASGSVMANGSMMQGLSMGAGAVMPYVLAAGALVSLVKSLDSSGTMHTGGAATAGATGAMATTGAELNFVVEINKQMQSSIVDMAGSISNTLNGLQRAFGKAEEVVVGLGFADDSSADGAWGALKILASGKTLVDWASGVDRWPGFEFSDGEAGLAEFTNKIATDVKGMISTLGLPEWALAITNNLQNGATLEEVLASLNQVAQIKLQLVEAGNALTLMGGPLAGLAASGEGAVLAVSNLVGGIDQLIAKAQGFMANYYTEQEQAGVLAASLTKSLEKAGFSQAQIAALQTRADFRTLLESIDINTEQGAEQFAALLTVQQQFADVQTYLEAQSITLLELVEAAPQVALLNLIKDQDLDNAKTALDVAQTSSDSLLNINSGVTEMVTAINSLNSTMTSGLNSIATATNSAMAMANSAIASASASAKATIAAQNAVASIVNQSETGSFETPSGLTSSTTGTFYSAQEIADAASYFASQGRTVADILSLAETEFGLNSQDVSVMARAAGIQGFADGTNYVPNDMLALIHKGEAIVPRAYNPAADGDLTTEIRGLREEVSMLRHEARATAVNTSKIAKLQDNWDVRGLTVKTDIDQPLDTVAV